MATSIIASAAEDLSSSINFTSTWIELTRVTLKRSGHVVTLSGVFKTLQAGNFGNPTATGQHPLCTLPESVRPKTIIDAVAIARNVNSTDAAPLNNFPISITINNADAESYPGIVYPNPYIAMNANGTIRFSTSWIV